MGSSRDPRSARQRLLEAATDLLDERGPAEITITEIVGRAGVTRPTFYATFTDLPTVYAEAAVARIAAAFPTVPVPVEDGHDRSEILRSAIVGILRSIEPHAQFFRRVLLGHGGHQVQARIIDLLAAEFRSRTPISAALARGPLPVERSSTAIAAAVSWTMLTWFADPAGEPVESLAEKLRDLIYHSVIGGLGRDDDRPATPCHEDTCHEDARHEEESTS